MAYVLAFIAGAIVGAFIISFCTMAKINGLDSEISTLRMRLAAAHRLFAKFNIDV